ncbi:helix-turn-helix domain-containing protein [Paenibacillus alvei]|uniref:Helix-turn-helix domain-containing protein n=1 Tax=Paenibacillus alvei TaxID=44250 RepID=A0ABT4H753_PAEAL|nr:helix-turn-helix domain-containing protein [Paenibacillus alvei]MCY9764808.1 helix-turn-helix domain-containing protein [Paenibacillus alvei]MCY9770715.1 helix-turn-helix domain-containing protein [Paenibacillus alvei]
MNINLGARIAELRKKKNLTQYDLGSLLNVSTSTVAMWERGHRDPSSEALSQLSSFFSVSSDYLLGLTDDPTIELRAETPPSISAWLRSTGTDLTEDEKEVLAEDMEEYFKMRKARILKKRQ